jgi:hypothetical protein
MSSTTGVQSLLTNVFRPVYTYSGTGFSTSVELSNVDTVSASNAILYRADIGDSKSNVYVGLNSGNAWSTVRGCSNAIGLGYGAAANISSVSNSVYIGTLAGANSSSNSNTIAIGYNAGQSSTGSSNIFLGTSTGCQVGNNNVYIGNQLTATSTPYTSNQFLVGTSNTVALAADLSAGCVSIGKSDTGMKYLTSPSTRFPSLNLDVAGYARIQTGLSIGRDPGNAVLDVNGDFRTDDGYGSLRFTHDQSTSNSVLTAVSSNNSLLTNIFPTQCGVFPIDTGFATQSIPIPGMTSAGVVVPVYVATSGASYTTRIISVVPTTGSCTITFANNSGFTAGDTIVWFAPKLF